MKNIENDNFANEDCIMKKIFNHAPGYHYLASNDGKFYAISNLNQIGFDNLKVNFLGAWNIPKNEMLECWELSQNKNEYNLDIKGKTRVFLPAYTLDNIWTWSIKPL